MIFMINMIKGIKFSQARVKDVWYRLEASSMGHICNEDMFSNHWETMFVHLIQVHFSCVRPLHTTEKHRPTTVMERSIQVQNWPLELFNGI